MSMVMENHQASEQACLRIIQLWIIMTTYQVREANKVTHISAWQDYINSIKSQSKILDNISFSTLTPTLNSSVKFNRKIKSDLWFFCFKINKTV